MTRASRAVDVAKMVAKSSVGETAQSLGISEQTVRRNMRRFKEEKSVARILILDIENAPAKGWFWGLWKQNIPIDMVEDDRFVLCWRAKWLFEADILGESITSEEALNRDGSSVLQGVWDLLEEADIVIGHNVIKHDLGILNAQFLKNGFVPPSPYRVIDTLKEAKKKFNFLSNKLAWLAKFLGVTQKIQHDGFPMWIGCMEGNQEDLDNMFKYCGGDITTEEEVYLKMRPWMSSHPNLGLHNLGEKTCANCGHTEFELNGYYYTMAGRFRSLRCKKCGAPNRERYAELTKEERQNLLVSVAR